MNLVFEVPQEEAEERMLLIQEKMENAYPLQGYSQELQKWLTPNGWLALEHGYRQKEKIIILFKKHGWNLYN